VHTADCPTARRLLERDSERWMRVDWAEEMTRSFETQLHVLVQNGKGVLAQVASAVSSAEADITHLDMDPSGGSAARAGHPAQETTELRLLISVRDRVHLAEVLRTMRRSPVVLKVSRTRLH
jgi:GTP pyrophosphokinase/guanosine-3',5'-bis(diphosphate) 3'-pyrophosphohydrolase